MSFPMSVTVTDLTDLVRDVDDMVAASGYRGPESYCGVCCQLWNDCQCGINAEYVAEPDPESMPGATDVEWLRECARNLAAAGLLSDNACADFMERLGN